MFLTAEDYNTVTDAITLDVIQQSDELTRQKAENYAIAEISSYLRNRYDMDTAFAKTGSNRNPQLVMITVDIALYHLIAWLPKRMGYEVRKERYDAAVKMLTDVHNKMTWDLPLYTDPVTGETDINNPVKFGSLKKNTYDW